MRFNTGSMRNIYSPDVATANELMVDQRHQRNAKAAAISFGDR